MQQTAVQKLQYIWSDKNIINVCNISLTVEQWAFKLTYSLAAATITNGHSPVKS